MLNTEITAPIYNIAILASGNGTNAERIISYFSKHSDVKVALVIYNRKSAYVAQRAKNLNVKSVYFSDTCLNADKSILDILSQHSISHVVLAGFLSKIPSYLVEAYPENIINIHPALLPNYGGKGMYGHFVHEAVISKKEKESGITIHLVDEIYDNGQILFQSRCQVLENDNPSSLAEKIHKLEYTYYPEIIEKWVKSKTFDNSQS